MGEQFFRRQHHVRGEVFLELDGDFVNLRCQWPFDLATDEWIKISNRFRLADYLRATQALAFPGEHTVPGIEAGEVGFEVINDQTIRFRIVGTGRIRPTEFQTAFAATPEDLVP